MRNHMTTQATARSTKGFILREKYLCLIGGELVPSHSGRSFASTNPATGEKLADVPACDAEDVSRAVEAAQAAYTSWKKLTPMKRLGGAPR